MADEKKNPLIGAFRTPEPPKTPPGPAPAPPKAPADTKAPATGPTAPGKPGEDKKPTEPVKTPADTKIPATGTAAPSKPDEDKKPTEPVKVPADTKAPATGTATPGKPGDEKKPTEPVKAPADTKAPATGTAAPSKPDEDKKPTEPVKVPADTKAPATSTAVPDKPDDEKKPAEPPKAPADTKAPATGPTAPGKPGDEKKPTEPAKAPTDSKTATDAKAAAEDEIPKNFKLEIIPEDDLGKVVLLPIDLIDDFEGHPFPVNDDKEMWDLVESVKQFGVLENATVIPSEKNPGRYEMVAGHRRKRASQLSGRTHIPAIVRNMDHDTAVIYMVDSNLKRENLSPMVKARAYAMKLEAMKRKTGRRTKTDILTGEKPKQAVEELAAQTGESVSNIKRFTRLTKLEPELQQMVEEKKLPVNTAADISYLKPDEQKKLADSIEKEGGTVPSGTQAAALKKESLDGKLTKEKIESTVAPTKREENPPLKITLTEEDLRPYFPDKRTTIPDAKRGVREALDLRARALERKAKAAEAEKPKKPPAPTR